MEKIETGIALSIEKEFDRKKEMLATKEDIARLEGKLEARIAQSEARLTMRMFYFWIGQVAVISGILTYFFRAIVH